MQNGDSLIGENWYNEMVIVPFPGVAHKFYLFHIGASYIPGIYYSVIDMNGSGGLGSVILKNWPLANFDTFLSCNAVKHGNGRDWWVIFKPATLTANNSFYEFLVTPAGVSGPFIHSIGSQSYYANFGQIIFNNAANRLALLNAKGLLELYDFDRCTGIISNPLNISPEATGPPYPLTWSIEFSPNDSLIYVNSIYPVATIMQVNLFDTNAWQNRDTIAYLTSSLVEGGYLKRAPDDKIYWSNAYSDGMNFNYPYDSSEYNQYNMNLSVINNPNALGPACNFTPFSFYLGGKRTYYGLPNNPDYNMPAWEGSPCDTLTSVAVAEAAGSKSKLSLTYVSGWQKLFVNAQGLQGKHALLEVYDMQGNKVYGSNQPFSPTAAGGYFTAGISCSAWKSSLYLVILLTEKEKLSAKFVKEDS